MTFAVLIIVCFLPIYYRIEFSEEELSTLLSVGSMFLALSTFTKNHKIIKASVMNFLFVLINYLVIIVEKRHSEIIDLYNFYNAINCLFHYNVDKTLFR